MTDLLGLVAGGLLLFSVLVLTSWFAGLSILRAFAPIAVAVNPVAAVCLLLGGLAIWVLSRTPISVVQRATANASAGVIAALAAAEIVGSSCANGWTLEGWLAGGRPSDEALTQPASAGAAAVLLVAGITLLLAYAEKPRWRVVHRAATIANLCLGIYLVIAQILMAGHVLDASRSQPAQLQLALLLLVLCTAIATTSPHGSLPLLSSLNPQRATMLRRLCAAAVLIPVGLSIGTWYGESSAIYRAGLTAALGIVSVAAVASSIAGVSIRSLRESERLRLSAENAVRSQESFVAGLIEAVPNLIVVVSETGRITAANQALGQLYGISPEQAMGRTELELGLPSDEAERFRQADEAALDAAGMPLISEEHVTAASGARRWLLTTRQAISARTGDRPEVLCVSTDITDRKRLEEELASAKRASDRMSAAKSQFLSHLSHELKTPMNAILGFAQLLEMDPTGPRSVEYAERILRGGWHLQRLIDEVADIGTIEAGRLAVSLEVVDLAEVIAECLDIVNELANESGVKVDASDALRDTLCVVADRQRLRQILINLLSNAIKYNRADGLVYVKCVAGAASVRIDVIDTGEGISPEDRNRVFVPFERFENARSVEGMGLGLALSKRLASVMGGELDLAVSGPSGSVFFLELQRVAESVSTTEAVSGSGSDSPPVDSGALTVLYIEDRSSDFDLVRFLLEDLGGFHLLPARSGMEGIKVARQIQPALVLLDIHLPDVGGREVLKTLKSDPTTAGIPIVVVSGRAFGEEAIGLRSCGAAACLTKPVHLDALFQVMGQEARKDRAA